VPSGVEGPSRVNLERELLGFPSLQALLDAVKIQKLSETHVSEQERRQLQKLQLKLKLPSLAELLSLLKEVTGCTFIAMHTGDYSKELVESSAPKPTFAETVSDHDRMIKKYISILTVVFRDEVEANRMSDSDLMALAETYTRVPQVTEDTLADTVTGKTPEQAYAWALSRSTIVFPYLTLKSASGNIKAARVESTRATSWGLRAGKFHLFPKESYNSDSNAWIMLDSVASLLVGEANIIRDQVFDLSAPQLTNEELEKNSSVSTIILRLLELMRSPGSATLRKGDNVTRDDLLKNQTDFVILETIFLTRSRYQNLEMSGDALSNGRRVKKVKRAIGTKGGTTMVDILVGYRLSETLAAYLHQVKEETMENEPFVRFIIDLLKLIAEKYPEDQDIPRAFFVAPSKQLLGTVRQGPTVRTKKGERANLYIPFSFAKSQECALLPEVLKREIVEIGTKVLKNLDHINKLPISDANYMLPYYKRYIRTCYSHADECRKRWRTSCLVPTIEALRPLESDLSRLTKLEGGIDHVQVERKLEEMEDLELGFHPFSKNPDELARTLELIQKDIRKKKDQRVRSTR